MTSLRWEEQQGGVAWFGYSGEVVVGMVVRTISDTIAWDATNAVQMKWTAKTNGEVKTFEAGKRAVERSWARWLDRANLHPRSSEGVNS